VHPLKNKQQTPAHVTKHLCITAPNPKLSYRTRNKLSAHPPELASFEL
jgi:hypothetical protein